MTSEPRPERKIEEMLAILEKAMISSGLGRALQINIRSMKRHLEEKLARLKLEREHEKSRHD